MILKSAYRFLGTLHDTKKMTGRAALDRRAVKNVEHDRHKSSVPGRAFAPITQPPLPQHHRPACHADATPFAAGVPSPGSRLSLCFGRLPSCQDRSAD